MRHKGEDFSVIFGEIECRCTRSTANESSSKRVGKTTFMVVSDSQINPKFQLKLSICREDRLFVTLLQGLLGNSTV